MNNRRPHRGSETSKGTPENLLSRGSSYYELDINYDPRTEHLKLKLLPIDSDGTNEKSSIESVIKEPEKISNRIIESSVSEDKKNKFKNILWNSKQVSLETKFKHANDVRNADEGKINNKILFTIKPNLNATPEVREENKRAEKVKKTRGAFTATDELTSKDLFAKKTKENRQGRIDESLLKSCEGDVRSSRTSVKKKKHDSHSENATTIKKSRKPEDASENDNTQGSSSKSNRTNPLKRCSSECLLQKNLKTHTDKTNPEVYYVLLPEKNKKPVKVTENLNEEYSYEYVRKIVKRKSRSKNSVEEREKDAAAKSPKVKEEMASTRIKSKTVVLRKTLEIVEDVADKKHGEKCSKSKEKSKHTSARKLHEDIEEERKRKSVHKKEKEKTSHAKKSDDRSTKKDKIVHGESAQRKKTRKRYNSPASFEKRGIDETLIQEITYSDYNADKVIIEENKNVGAQEKHFIVKNSDSKNIEPIYIYKANRKHRIKEEKAEDDKVAKIKKKESKKAKDESSEKKSGEHAVHLYRAETKKCKKEKGEGNEEGANKKREKSREQSASNKSHVEKESQKRTKKDSHHNESTETKSLKASDKEKRKRSKHLTELNEKDLTASSEQARKKEKQKESSQENSPKSIKEKVKTKHREEQKRYKEPISTEDDYLKTKLLKKIRMKSRDKASHDKKSKKSKHSLKVKKKTYKNKSISTDENTITSDKIKKSLKIHNINDAKTLSRLIENHHKAYLESGLKSKKQKGCMTESSVLSEKRKESPPRKDQIADSLEKSFKKMRSQKIYKMREVNKSSLDSFSSKTQDRCRGTLHFCSLGPIDQNVNGTKELRHEVSLSHLHIYPDLSQYTTPSRMLDIKKPISKSPARSQELTKRDKPRKKNSLLKSIEKKTVLSEVITKKEKNNYSDQSDLINYYSKPKKRRLRSNQFTRKLVCTENVIETTLRASNENCSVGFVVEGIEPPKRLGFVGGTIKTNHDKNSKLHKTVFSVLEIESTTINSTDYNTDLSLCEISAFSKTDSSKITSDKQVVTDVFVHQIDTEKEQPRKNQQNNPEVHKDDITRSLNIIKDLDSLLADIKQNLPSASESRKSSKKLCKLQTSTLTKDFFDSQPQYSSDTETTYNVSISQDCQTDDVPKVDRKNRGTESQEASMTDFVTCFTKVENTNKSFKMNIVDTKGKSTKQDEENQESHSSRVIRICLGDCFQTTAKQVKDQNTDTVEDNEDTKEGVIKKIPKRNIGLENKLSKILRVNPLIKKRSRDGAERILLKTNRRHYLANECVYLLSNILCPSTNGDCTQHHFQQKQKTPFTKVQTEDSINETNKRQIDNMFVKKNCSIKETEREETVPIGKPSENNTTLKSTSTTKVDQKNQKRYQNIFECNSSKTVDSPLSLQREKSKGSSLLLTKNYKDTARIKAYQKRKLYGEELRKTNKTNLDWNIKLTPTVSETKTKNETVVKFGITQNGTVEKLDEDESKDQKKIFKAWDCERTYSAATLSPENSKRAVSEQHVDKKRGFTLHSKIEGSSLNIYISNKDRSLEDTTTKNGGSSSSTFLPCQLYVESASNFVQDYEALRSAKRKLEEYEDEKPKKMARKPRLIYSFSDNLIEEIGRKNSGKKQENSIEGELSQVSLSEDSLEKADNQNKMRHNFFVYKSLVDVTVPLEPLNDDLFQNETDLNCEKEQIITPISDESGYESCKSKKSPSVKKLFKKPSVVFDLFRSKSKNCESNVECSASKVDVDVSESETTMSRSVSRNSISTFRGKSTGLLPWKSLKKPKSVDGSARCNSKTNIVRRTLSNLFFKKSKSSKNEMPVIISDSKSSNRILKGEMCEASVEKWRTNCLQEKNSKKKIPAEDDLRKNISTQTITSETVQKKRDVENDPKSKMDDFENGVNYQNESPRDSDDERNKSKNCCPCANIFQKPPCFLSRSKTLPDLEQIMKDPQKSKIFLKNLEFYQKNMDQCHEYARKISIEKHFKRYNMNRQSNYKEIPLNVLLGKNDKSKVEKSEFAQGDTLKKSQENASELVLDDFLVTKTQKRDRVEPPEFFSENVKQVFFCNASYITFPVHEIIIDAANNNKKKRLDFESSNSDCNKICECSCFSDDPQSDSETENSDKSSQNKLQTKESEKNETLSSDLKCEECPKKISSRSVQDSEKPIEKDDEHNEKIDNTNTSNIDDEFSRDDEETTEEFMGQVSLVESSEKVLRKSPSKEEALKKLEEIRNSMTEQELFNRLLVAFENQDKIADELFNDEDFFAAQLNSVKSKKSVEDFFEHQKNQLPIQTFSKDPVLFLWKPKKPFFFKRTEENTTSSDHLIKSVSFLKKEENYESRENMFKVENVESVEDVNNVDSDDKSDNSVQPEQFSETTVVPVEIGKCFRRGFRPDNMALSGESYEADDGSPTRETLTTKPSYIDFSERQTPLEYLLALGFSVDEATNAIKNIDVTNRLCAAIREARIWINKISTTQGTLLYLVSFKTTKKIMRYFLQLVEAIINGRINNAVKLDSFIRLLINIENGDVDMIKVFGIGRFEDETNEDQIVKKQMKKVFTDVYLIANTEAKKHNKTLSNESIELLRIVAAKYRAGLVPHLELIARYIGQNLIVNEVQLQAAMIYLSRLNTTNVKLNEFERYCDIKCQKDQND